ncbi:desmoglein-2-like protein [Seriola aureovittata]|uniref:desmoglein-2-like protein n=1 Tax=Seriola aureovittata TaxID=2871759 RepID=UPI0024BE9874|nr:desmoglein-2-like protein [Seriola aureovittata]
MAPLLKCAVFILLAIFLTSDPVEAEGNDLHRQKREWILAPRKLKENIDYTGLQYIAKIHSDKASKQSKILYYLSGPGVDQPPQHRFSIDAQTGYVKVNVILDREDIAFYHLKGSAKYIDGTPAENDIDLKITVEDENDNPPIIQAKQVGFVNESSATGTFVMKVIATDADEANTTRSKIYYSIVEESSSAGMFYINSQTGEVIVKRNTLDRETKDTYTLTVSATDMEGQAIGKTGTEQIEIKILDINDNVPTLEKETYEGSVEENTINVEVMRIKAIDMDLIHTENWLAVFEIISGNEAGYFSITTDNKTNEGIIMIHKALDYEQLKMLNLEVAISNIAKYNMGTTTSTTKSYPIKINVINQKEGPRFQPTTKVVSVSEGKDSVFINKIITNYAAIDSDTLQKATNVRYAKLYDEDNWLIIDEKTADIKLNKLPDRESKYLINGTYYAKIICISNETPSKTATGTIAIQVEDFNDHCPKLTATTHTMCFEDNVIYATAVDEDEFPNSAPFEFTVIQGSSKGKWTVEHLNETTAILRDQAKLWPGIYRVAVDVKDQQGKSCGDVQMMDVTVCTCDEITRTCRSRLTTTSGFGAAGVLLLLLGLLLLLLLPLLLLFCLCGGAAAVGSFKPIPFDTKQGLISYHTEGQGEDKEVPLLHVPVEVDHGTINANDGNGANGYGELGGGAAGGGQIFVINDKKNYGHYVMGQKEREVNVSGMMTGQEDHFSQYGAGAFDGMALSEQFLEEYYSSKSNHAVQQCQQKDALLVYDYEGQESLAGSVGCCSLLENDDDLAFLNDLGPKFKTLAEICQGSNIVIESVDISPIRPVSPVRPSTHTHMQTHTESMRERDHVNINTINTSNVASGSSTIIQDKIMMPSPTVLIQQPTMYYAATPMYVVESQPQMVLVAGGTQQQSVAQVGLSQGLVQVGGLQGTQGVVLVDRQVGMGGVTGQVAQGLSQGTVSRSRKVLVVENGSSGGGQGLGQGSTAQGLEVSQGVQSFSLSSHGSTGSHDDSSVIATPKLQGNQKLVVQHKKVLVTERNFESSTRA